MKGFGDEKNSNSEKFKNPKRDKDLVLKNKLDIAKNCLIAGDVAQAEKIYSHLINNGFISYDLFFSYALLSRNRSNFKLARKLLIQSISKYPAKIGQYILLAEISRLEKDFLKAQDLLLTAFKINPRNSNTAYNFSLLYRDLDKKEEALSSINKAIKLMPNNYVYKLLKADLILLQQRNIQ